MGEPGATYGSVALVQPGTAPSRRRIEAVHSPLLVGCFALAADVLARLVHSFDHLVSQQLQLVKPKSGEILHL